MAWEPRTSIATAKACYAHRRRRGADQEREGTTEKSKFERPPNDADGNPKHRNRHYSHEHTDERPEEDGTRGAVPADATAGVTLSDESPDMLIVH